MKKHIETRQHSRRGAVLLLLAFVLVGLLSVLALSINVSLFQYKKTQEQSAADLASISALHHYANNRDTSSELLSRTYAGQILTLNQGGGDPATESNRLEFGYVDDARLHNPLFTADALRIDSVHVRRSENPEPVPVFLGTLFGRRFHHISAESVSAYQPIEVVLCLDASRSMNRYADSNGSPNGSHVPPEPGSRWFKLVTTVDMFLDQVQRKNPFTRVALVTFGGGVSHDIVSPLDADFTRKELGFQLARDSEVTTVMQSYVNHPALGFGTFIFDAIESSMEVMATSNPQAQRFIILLSDGEQWTRNLSRPRPWVAATEARNKGIPIHTINFQQGTNEDLTLVADETNGDSFQAANGPALEAAFDTLLDKFEVNLAR